MANLPNDLVSRLRGPWVRETVDRERKQAADELERLMNLIDSHNHNCQSMCGFGEQEGVRCGYRQYFPKRCSTCPTDWMIDR